jgi:hypothetical protein
MSEWLNLEGVKEQKFEAMPAGVYALQVDKAEVKPTKDGTGEFVELTLKVAEGDYSKRMLRHRFNTKNKSEQAQSIGLSQLKTFLLAAGHAGKSLSGASDLVGLKVQAVVHLKKDQNGVARPEVKYFQTAKAQASTSAPQGF